MRAWAAVLCCALGSSPAQAAHYEEGLRLKQLQQLEAAANEFRAVLEQSPDDLKALEQLAVVEGWRGHYDAAIGHWRRLIAAEPDNAYYRVGLARVQYWKQEPQAALDTLDAAGDDYDAMVLRGDVSLAAGRPDAARASYRQAQATPQGAADAELARKIERLPGQRRWRIDAGAAIDRFTAQRGHEGSQYAQIGYAFTPAVTGYLHYDRYDQFDTIDHGVIAGAYWTPAPHWLLQAEAGVTADDEDFRPSRQYAFNAEWLPDFVVQPLLSLRLAAYEQGDVETVTPGLRFIAEGIGNLEVRHAFSDNTDGSDTAVTSLRAGTSLGRYAPYLVYARGEEALPPLAKAEIAVWGAGVFVDLSAAWGLRVDYAYEDRQDVYLHRTYGVGATYRF